MWSNLGVFEQMGTSDPCIANSSARITHTQVGWLSLYEIIAEKRLKVVEELNCLGSTWIDDVPHEAYNRQMVGSHSNIIRKAEII